MLVRFFQGRRVINEELISLGEKSYDFLSPKKGELRLDEKEKAFMISGQKFSFLVSRKTGLIEEAKLGDETIFAGGPYLQVRVLKGQEDSNQVPIMKQTPRPGNWKKWTGGKKAKEDSR